MSTPTRVKFISRAITANWLRQFPGHTPVWGECQFIFDPNATGYDWLVVYDDLQSSDSAKIASDGELLRCNPHNTLLITGEPSSIKTYGSAFLDQFGHLLTTHPAWAQPHRSRIYSQPALQWFYGIGANHQIPYDELKQAPWEKSKDLSTVCSSKRHKGTLHALRYDFSFALPKVFPDIDIFGHGTREIDDKAQAIHDYRYHVAFENFRDLHHWTEKLADPFLGLSLPFYYGAPNAADYFPRESFVAIDARNFKKSTDVMRSVMNNNEYADRLPYLLNARKLLMERYNIFAVVEQIVREKHVDLPANSGITLLSRKKANKKHLLSAIRYGWEKTHSRIQHRIRY